MYFQTINIDNTAIFIYKYGQAVFFAFSAAKDANDSSYLPEKKEKRPLTPLLRPSGSDRGII